MANGPGSSRLARDAQRVAIQAQTIQICTVLYRVHSLQRLAAALGRTRHLWAASRKPRASRLDTRKGSPAQGVGGWCQPPPPPAARGDKASGLRGTDAWGTARSYVMARVGGGAAHYCTPAASCCPVRCCACQGGRAEDGRAARVSNAPHGRLPRASVLGAVRIPSGSRGLMRSRSFGTCVLYCWTDGSDVSDTNTGSFHIVRLDVRNDVRMAECGSKSHVSV